MDKKHEVLGVAVQTSSKEPLRNRNGSSTPDSGRTTPPDCAICLGPCRNKCFTDSCLHQFCFDCLLTWSKIKAECPLCKQMFKVIIHNVRANDQYEEYKIQPSPEQYYDRFMDMQDISFDSAPRFRYRTTLTLQRQQGMEIQRLLMRFPIVRFNNNETMVIPAPRPQSRRPVTRQDIYTRNLWATPLPDVTGRYRDCTPEFYRNNPAQIHRLALWLRRELPLLTTNVEQVFVRIISYLGVHQIKSRVFKHMLEPYLLAYTEHFMHELHTYARSPYDLIGYDRTVQYAPDPRTVDTINELSSDDVGDDSDDSDVQIISSNPAPNLPISEPTTSSALGSLSNSVIPIETIHSESEESNDDEVVVVGYIKPPGDRTPEVVDLASSDSDSVVIESETTRPIEVLDETNTSHSFVERVYNRDMPSSSGLSRIGLGLVKLCMKRARERNSQLPTQRIDIDSESDNDSDQRHPKRTKKVKRLTKKQRKSYDNASTECTDCDTDLSDNNNLNTSPSTSRLSNTCTRESRFRELAYKIKKSLHSNVDHRDYVKKNDDVPLSVEPDVILDSNEETEVSKRLKMKGISYKSLSKYIIKNKFASTSHTQNSSSDEVAEGAEDIQ